MLETEMDGGADWGGVSWRGEVKGQEGCSSPLQQGCHRSHANDLAGRTDIRRGRRVWRAGDWWWGWHLPPPGWETRSDSRGGTSEKTFFSPEVILFAAFQSNICLK